MVLLVVLAILMVIFAWVLVSLFTLEIDTRVPFAKIKWTGIGTASIWYDEDWWFSVRIFFFRKTMRVSEIKRKKNKVKKEAGRKRKKRMTISKMLAKTVRVIKTFSVTEWQVALDTGDFCLNGQLYPLNYLPGTVGHLHMNFNNQNFLLLRTRNRPWKVLYAFFWK